METYGDTTPSAEDTEFLARRVESYRCKDCLQVERFPRYNHPVKLYETKRGRCGEWANAFTGICVALGHQAREIHDWTDHVWTEVWIDEYKRWVHMDSCENSFDQPLLYEDGWGKKLTYCLAVSNVEVLDVTKRYVIDPYFYKTRRTLVNEEWLDDHLKTKREQLWEMSGQPLSELKDRFEKEIAQICDRHDQQEKFLPRQSGSLEWRLSRMEMGNN